MIFCFDLDGTICTDEKGIYNNCKRKLFMVNKINQLYEDGHTIIIETARGSESDLDWFSFTEHQLKQWGVKYHKLRTGKKIFADYYIDDKNLSIDEFKRFLE